MENFCLLTCDWLLLLLHYKSILLFSSQLLGVSWVGRSFGGGGFVLSIHLLLSDVHISRVDEILLLLFILHHPEISLSNKSHLGIRLLLLHLLSQSTLVLVGEYTATQKEQPFIIDLRLNFGDFIYSKGYAHSDDMDGVRGW